MLGRGGGQVVSLLSFSSDDPSSNPTVFSVKFVFEKYENKLKEAGVGPFKKDHSEMLLRGSVTRKKSPNVYKSCPKMISLEIQ